MPRPKIPRFVGDTPEADYFTPKGIPQIKEVILTIDEIEAIRLKDLLNLEQEECAKRMKISRGTFQRILYSARNKIADALINGKAIRIEGGVVEMPMQGNSGRAGRGHGFGRFGRGFGRGASGYCVCPVCGHKEAKQAGTPCRTMKCSKCGATMIRGE